MRAARGRSYNLCVVFLKHSWSTAAAPIASCILSAEEICKVAPHGCVPVACSETESSGLLGYSPLTSPTWWKNIPMLSAVMSPRSSLRLIFYVRFHMGRVPFKRRRHPNKFIGGKELVIGSEKVICRVRACCRARIVVWLRAENKHSCMTEENVISSSTGKNLA